MFRHFISVFVILVFRWNDVLLQLNTIHQRLHVRQHKILLGIAWTGNNRSIILIINQFTFKSWDAQNVNIAGIATPFITCVPTEVSEHWFSGRQRTVVTAVLGMGDCFGLILGKYLYPYYFLQLSATLIILTLFLVYFNAVNKSIYFQARV